MIKKLLVSSITIKIFVFFAYLTSSLAQYYSFGILYPTASLIKFNVIKFADMKNCRELIALKFNIDNKIRVRKYSNRNYIEK